MTKRLAGITLIGLITCGIVHVATAQPKTQPEAVLEPGAAAASAKTPDEPETAATELDSFNKRLSYAIGVNIGQNLKNDGLDVNPSLVSRGIEDALTGGKRLLTEEQLRATMQAFQEQMASKQAEQRKDIGSRNIEAARAFLEKNKNRKGIITQPSGLQYEVLRKSAGNSPKAGDAVTVHYRGTLLDGTQFDSSYDRNQPATFKLNQVIPGWSEGVQLMQEGSQYRFYVPPALGYGERGTPGGPIPPNAALIFEVELIKVGE